MNRWVVLGIVLLALFVVGLIALVDAGVNGAFCDGNC